MDGEKEEEREKRRRRNVCLKMDAPAPGYISNKKLTMIRSNSKINGKITEKT